MRQKVVLDFKIRFMEINKRGEKDANLCMFDFSGAIGY